MRTTMIDESKVAARITARKEADAILELIAETTMQWADDQKDIRRHFLETIDTTVHAALFPTVVTAITPPTGTVQVVVFPPGVEEALKIVEAIESMADEVPAEADDFATSVVERSKSIGRTIERSNSVTNGQSAALENMRDGLARWIRD